jgi:hypothetical protein
MRHKFLLGESYCSSLIRLLSNRRSMLSRKVSLFLPLASGCFANKVGAYECAPDLLLTFVLWLMCRSRSRKNSASVCSLDCWLDTDVNRQSIFTAVIGSSSSSRPIYTSRATNGSSKPVLPPSRILRMASRVFVTVPLSCRSARMASTTSTLASLSDDPFVPRSGSFPI